MHVEDHLSICSLKNKLVFSVGSWHQDVVAKRIIMGVWKASGRKSHIPESDHSTRGSLIIEAMQGVVIATQRMHIELYVYESSPMELVGVHPTRLLMKT